MADRDGGKAGTIEFPTGQVRWGIIGCGTVCEVKSGPALQSAGRSVLTAVMRRDRDRAADFARRHGVPRWFDDASALIADDTVDAIYVATPPDSHERYAVMALAADKPVYCEKPMAPTVAACERMAHAADAACVPLITAYYRRALPRFEEMREIIQNGAIGTIKTVSVRQARSAKDCPAHGWRAGPAVAGGGVFADLMPHVFDWLDHVFGPAHDVQAVSERRSSDVSGERICFQIDHNVVSVIGDCNLRSEQTEDKLTVTGTEGEVSMPFFGPGPVRLERAGRIQEVDLPDPPHVQQPMIERAVACLLDGVPNPCDPFISLRATATLQAILDCTAYPQHRQNA